MNLLDIPMDLFIDVLVCLDKKQLHLIMGTNKLITDYIQQAHEKQEHLKKRAVMQWTQIDEDHDMYDVMTFRNVIVDGDITSNLSDDNLYLFKDQKLYTMISPQLMCYVSPNCHVVGSNKYILDTSVYDIHDFQLKYVYEIDNHIAIGMYTEMVVCYQDALYAFSQRHIYKCVDNKWQIEWFIPSKYWEIDGYLRVASWRQYTVMFLLRQNKIILFDMENHMFKEVYATGAAPLIVYPHHECKFLFYGDQMILFRSKMRLPIEIFCLTMSEIHGVIHGVWQDAVLGKHIEHIMFWRQDNDWFFSIKQNVVSFHCKDEKRWDLVIQ